MFNVKTKKKKVIDDNLKQACYQPHKDVRRGRLVIDPAAYKTPGRQTNLCISKNCRIDLTGDIYLGPWVMIGDGAQILTHDHFYDSKRPLLIVQEERGVRWQNKIIEADVWIHRATILYQVTFIPRGCVIGAGAVLTKNPTGPYEIWAGNPAVKVGERK